MEKNRKNKTGRNLDEEKKKAKKKPTKFNTTNQKVLKSIGSDLRAEPQELFAARMALYAKVQENGGVFNPNLQYINDDIGHVFKPLERHTKQQSKIDRMKGDPSKIKAAQKKLDREIAIYKKQMGDKTLVGDNMMKDIPNSVMATGGTVTPNKAGIVRHYIESPDVAIRESQINVMKAKAEAASNPWTQGLDMLGTMAVDYGTNMMSSGAGGAGGAVAAYGTNEDGLQEFGGGGVVAGGGDGGAFGQGFGDWMGNNSGYIQAGAQMLPMLAQMFGPGFAMGTGEQGVPGVPVEVEGQEVIETPNGEVGQIQGASHEEGGVDMILPEETKVYSKRIKKLNESMAERKKKRTARVDKIKNLISKSPGDTLLKNTLKKVQASAEIEESEDLKTQEMIGMMKNAMQTFAYGTSSQGVKSYADGTPPDGIIVDFDEYNNPIYSNIGSNTADNGFTPTREGGGTRFNISSAETQTSKEGREPGEENKWKPEANFGDIVSMGATYMGATEPLKDALQNAAEDTPNINAFEDYGQEALDTNNKAKGYIAQQRANKIKEILSGQQAAIKRGRNSARGVNQMRGLDIASEMATNQQKSAAYDAFAQQMMANLSEEGRLESDRDAKVMQGEKERDLNDRMDKDIMDKEISQAKATRATGFQELGKDMSQISNRKEERALADAGSSNFKWDRNKGLTDKAGNVVASPQEIKKIQKANPDLTEEEVIEVAKIKASRKVKKTKNTGK